MPWNVLLLPLLGGYFSLHLFFYTRYRAQRLDGYRLLLESAVAGLALLFVTRVFIVALKRTFIGIVLREVWVDLAGDHPYAGTAAVTMLFGVVLSLGLNVGAAMLHHRIVGRGSTYIVLSRRVGGKRLPFRARLLRVGKSEIRMFSYSWKNHKLASWFKKSLSRGSRRRSRFYQAARDHALDWALSVYGDPEQRMLRRALKDEALVMVTLKDRKVYVGLLLEMEFRPDHRFLALQPVVTGHRDPTSLAVSLHTGYPSGALLERFDLQQSDFVITLPLDQIQSAHRFDMRVWDQHFKPQTAPRRAIANRHQRPRHVGMLSS